MKSRFLSVAAFSLAALSLFAFTLVAARAGDKQHSEPDRPEASPRPLGEAKPDGKDARPHDGKGLAAKEHKKPKSGKDAKNAKSSKKSKSAKKPMPDDAPDAPEGAPVAPRNFRLGTTKDPDQPDQAPRNFRLGTTKDPDEPATPAWKGGRFRPSDGSACKDDAYRRAHACECEAELAKAGGGKYVPSPDCR